MVTEDRLARREHTGTACLKQRVLSRAATA
jgi:hypothetical protein